MPLFMTDMELLGSDPSSVAAKADEVILDLRRQLETARAEADAAAIASDQTYNVLEQRYASLSAEFARAQAESARLSAAADLRLSEIADAQAAKHELHLKAIAKDGEIERLQVELSELHKSNRQFLFLISQKDTEIGEKNGVIQSYFDKIVKLTENMNEKERRLQENEAEVNRSRATCARLTQEKELLDKHNNWLNEDLTDKVNSLVELRRTYMDFEADMADKLSEAERRFDKCSRSLKQSEERVKEYSLKLTTLEEDLSSCKDAAANNDRRCSAELSTVSRLVELYKESSDAWSKKAVDLEGVIKALETHLSQVEIDYKSKLEGEASIRKDLEKDIQEMKEKLDKCEVELEKARKANEKNLLLESSLYDDARMEEVCLEVVEIGNQTENTAQDVLRKPIGISGTALAASLLRDGWSLAKMYEKYQEAADALRHEKWGRKHTEAILERVLHEIEEKAEIILEERVEHEKMVGAYTSISEKLQQAQLEHDAYEASIRNLKAELKHCERDYTVVQKENVDLQQQVAVLLKECRDIQLRCGMVPKEVLPASLENGDGIDIEQVTFKDIMDLVQQNCQLKNLVQSLSSAEEARLLELKENLQMEQQKQENEAASKVEAVLKKCEEQGLMIDSLHNSVAMYKKLYEEEHRMRKSGSNSSEAARGGNNDLLLLFEGSQEMAKKAHEEVISQARSLEQDLSNLRNELLAIQLERDKFAMEAKHAREKLDDFMMEFDRQKKESNGVSARNVELSQLIVEHQRRLRESTDSLHNLEERCRKLSVEVSVLKNEKEVFINSEKRASDEIRNLTERVYRLQSSLDTVQAVEEVHEESRLRERKRLEENVERVEREWAEAKKELQAQRDRVHLLEAERERAIEASMRQVNEMRKELSDAWHAVSVAESRAVIAEDRLANLDSLRKTVDKAALNGKENIGSSLAENEDERFHKLCEEVEKIKEEADANKSYMLQYKEIARTNEVALKQTEFAHEEFKREAEKLKDLLESEILSLREKAVELETECVSKANEAFSAHVAKEDALSSAASEVQHLKEENSSNIARVLELENQICCLKDNLEREHERWRSSQSNYERQVILQSETIQELSKTSQDLASLQNEMSKLRSQSDSFKSENELLKASWELERLSVVKAKEEAEKNLKEIDEQNKILHKQLENVHLKYADKELSSAHATGTGDEHMENDLQSIISYLRRGKEIAETEISLLRQEKLRLQSQLDIALKSSERAQALLRSERDSAKERLYTDGEYNSLKLQVREISLLRESNAELRAENKHNFEECQRLNEIVQNTKEEAERLARDKEIAVQGYQKEVQVLKSEKMRLEQEIMELNGKYKNVDVAEIESVKDELQKTVVKLKEMESETDRLKGIAAERQENLVDTERKLAECQKELDEHLQKINGFLQKELLSNKKVEQHLKEKEDLQNENQSLRKQLEESLAGKSLSAASASEKDTRIQMLERLVENVRESLRKEKEENKREKTKRMRNEKLLIDRVQMVIQEKKKLEEEIKTHKLNIRNILESCGINASQLPSESGLEERSVAYFFAVDKYEEAANSGLGNGNGIGSLPTDSSPLEAATIEGQQIPKAPSRPGSTAVQIEPKEKSLGKTNDGRKPVRRIINRPCIKQPEEPVDAEISETEGIAFAEGKRTDSREEEAHVGLPPTSRKRPTSSLVPELKDEIAQEETGTEPIFSAKKVKGSESPSKVSERRGSMEHFQSASSLPLAEDTSLKNTEVSELDTDEKLTDADSVSKQELVEVKDVAAPEMDVNIETHAVPTSPDTPREGVVLPVEMLKSDEAMEVSQLVPADDEMEEGEMPPDALELQPDEGESAQPETTTSEVGGFTDTDDAIEAAVSNETSVVIDETVVTEPGKTNHEQLASDIEEGQFNPPGGDAEPTEVQLDAAMQEQGFPGAPEEPGEPKPQTSEAQAPRTSSRINIIERARQNARLRQAGMSTLAQSRGLRRDVGRGRGRGPNSGDREQQG